MLAVAALPCALPSAGGAIRLGEEPLPAPLVEWLDCATAPNEQGAARALRPRADPAAALAPIALVGAAVEGARLGAERVIFDAASAAFESVYI